MFLCLCCSSYLVKLFSELIRFSSSETELVTWDRDNTNGRQCNQTLKDGRYNPSFR